MKGISSLKNKTDIEFHKAIYGIDITKEKSE